MYSFTLKGGGAADSSEIMVPLYQITLHHTPENHSLNTLQTGDADLRFYVTTVQDG